MKDSPNATDSSDTATLAEVKVLVLVVVKKLLVLSNNPEAEATNL